MLMGVTLSSAKDIKHFDSDPAVYKAGLAVSYGSDGLLSLLKSAGMRAGVSIGRSLSDTKQTSVCLAGEEVPVRLSLKRARGTVTISSFANLLTTAADTITIAGVVFTAQAGAATPGLAVFQAATSNNATAASLAAQINAHASIGLLVRASVLNAIVTIAAAAGGSAGNAITLVYTDNGSGNIGAAVSGATLASGSDVPSAVDFVVIGAKAYCDDITGEFVDPTQAGCTVTDAVYVSGPLTGVYADSSTCAAARVDMVGGL